MSTQRITDQEYTDRVNNTVKEIQAGKVDFPCQNSFQRGIVHRACQKIGKKAINVTVSHRVKFSCKDWDLYNGNIGQMYKNRDTLVQDYDYYSSRGVDDCDGRLCDQIPANLRKNRLGNNYDDDQAIYFFYHTEITGLRVI